MNSNACVSVLQVALLTTFLSMAFRCSYALNFIYRYAFVLKS